MSSTLSITPQNIIDHRAARKAAGMVGCISGRPVPEMDFFGYRDVQSWRPADPMKPHCLCFDCRELWDNDASIDLQLILNGDEWAREVYATLLPMDMRPAPRPQHKEGANPAPLALPMRSNGGGISMMPERGDSPAPVPLPPRVSTSGPSYGSFGEIPMSLPAPRARDIMNESPDERLRGDLAVLRGKLQSDLVVVMDSRRHAITYDNPDEAAAFLSTVRDQETVLWKKLDAIDLLLNA